MKISELFVQLGVKGSEKGVAAILAVKTGMKELFTASLEAKVAIVGAIYAIERLMSSSAAQGTHLNQLSTYLGRSTKELQQYEYAAQQAGVSNQEFEQSLNSIYNVFQQNRTSKAPLPAGFAIAAQAIGGFDIDRAYDDVFYALERLNKVATSNLDRNVKEKILKDFGFGQNMYYAAQKGVYNAKNFSEAPFFTQKEIDNLSKVNVEFANLETKVKMFFGHFTAEHGEDIVKNIDKLATSFFSIATSLDRIATKLGAFKLITDAFQGWSTILDFVANKLEGKDNTNNKLAQFLYPHEDLRKELQRQEKDESIRENKIREQEKSTIEENRSFFYNKIKSFFSPSIDFANKQSENTTSRLRVFENNGVNVPSRFSLPGHSQTNSINQNIYFQNDGSDAFKLKDDLNGLNREIINTWRQLSANGQPT